jgi:hypothetical protein
MAYLPLMSAQAPAQPDFDTPEEEAAYDQWFREKVARSLANTEPTVPHDEVMKRVRKIIENANRAQQK